MNNRINNFNKYYWMNKNILNDWIIKYLNKLNEWLNYLINNILMNISINNFCIIKIIINIIIIQIKKKKW